MLHLKLFETFQKDAKNISIKNIKRPKINESQEDIDKLDEELEKLFKELVPSEGPCKTVEGEMIRSIMRVLYRYFNDGDFFYKGYGKETAGPSVKWLKEKSPLSKEIKAAFNYAKANTLREGSRGQYDAEKDGYLIGLYKAVDLIYKYVKERKGNYTDNTEDSR